MTAKFCCSDKGMCSVIAPSFNSLSLFCTGKNDAEGASFDLNVIEPG